MDLTVPLPGDRYGSTTQRERKGDLMLWGLIVPTAGVVKEVGPVGKREVSIGERGEK